MTNPKYKTLRVTPDQFSEEVVAAEANGYTVMGNPHWSGGGPGQTVWVRVMLVHYPAPLHVHRFKENPEEQAFAEAWKAADRSSRTETLQYLMCPPPCDRNWPPEINDRDRLVAGTVIQWLGSPVGLCFLRDLGFVKKGVNE